MVGRARAGPANQIYPRRAPCPCSACKNFLLDQPSMTRSIHPSAKRRGGKTSVRMRRMRSSSNAAAVEFTGGRQVGRAGPGPGGRAAMPWRDADTKRRKTRGGARARPGWGGFASRHVHFGVPAKRGAHMAGWPRAPRDDDAIQRALRDGWMDGLATPVRSVVARQGGPGRGPSSRGRTVQMESCRDTCMLAALAYGSGASQPSLARVLG